MILGKSVAVDTMKPGSHGAGMSSSPGFENHHPATVSKAVQAIIDAQPRFVEIAQDLHASPCDWMRQLDTLRRHCSLDWSLVPNRDFPEASREDVLGLALCALQHALSIDPECSPHRRTVIASALARRASSDPVVPLLHMITQSSRDPEAGDLADRLMHIQPLLDLFGSVLASQEEARCSNDYQRLLEVLSAPGSGFAVASSSPNPPRLLQMSARLAICNTLMRTPGLSVTRRTQVLHATSCFGVVSAPSSQACNDPRRLAPTG